MTEGFKFENVEIKAFRGLADLKLDSCSRINLVLGNNNIGKTSVLEALSMFRNDDPYNMLFMSFNRDSSYSSVDGVKYLFPIGKNKLELGTVTSKGKFYIKSNYELKKVIFNKGAFLQTEDQYRASMIERTLKTLNADGKEITQISGDYDFNGQIKKYSFMKYDLIASHISRPKKNINRIIYVSPSSHFELDNSLLDEVLRSDSYKKVFIKVLQMFEPDIEDLLYLSNDGLIDSKEPFIKRTNQDAEPLSIYGDGIKKAISLAACVAIARKGVLLVDEIETSLYFGYFKSIFSFLVKACIHFDVQLFITTHSDEVINTYINIANEYNDDNLLSIFTLRRNGRKTSAARISGREQFGMKQALSWEIRQ